jgi:hypothetical protein
MKDMTDPFPALTIFLENIMLYLIFIGIILASISAIVAGILFLPIFGLSERRASLGGTALRMTVLGLFIILLAIPTREALLRNFPVPTNIPAIPTVPMSTPGATPIVTPTRH